ncbi:MAG: S8 family serine peptidase [Candidatus Peregrinibacteria bacterium]|nr:S8 family serine peptidase [Candidatus Peregrinibacteria bacterium]
MKKLLILALGAFAGYLVLAQSTGALEANLIGEPLGQSVSEAVRPNHFIVQLQPGTDVQSFALESGLVPLHIYERVGNGFSTEIAPGLLGKLENDPSVVAVIPDRLIQAHPKPENPGNKGGGGTTGQVTSDGLARIGGEPGSSPYTGAGVGIAIVDTGIDLSHADLNVASECFTAHGSECMDDNGHGTHVAGIAAALNNEIDIIGVAPGSTVYSIKVLNQSGSGYDSDIVAGLEWIYSNADQVSPAIKVVNLSLGRSGSVDDNPVMHQAFQNLVDAGITVVVSAGNSSSQEISEKIPAAYPEVMAIASTTAADGQAARRGACAGIIIPADTASYFTTDGAGVTVSAPGEARENVKNSCTINSEGILSLGLGGGTTRMSGTSMSSPFVAGTAALLYEKKSAVLPNEIRFAISSGADLKDSAPLNGVTASYTFDGVREGVLSVLGALSLIN